MTRKKTVALQVRLLPEEIAALDAVIRSRRERDAGCSAICRSSVMRDLVVAEIKRHSPLPEDVLPSQSAAPKPATPSESAGFCFCADLPPKPSQSGTRQPTVVQTAPPDRPC